MGVYDSVWVPCPKCGRKEAFQSKGSSEASLRDFFFDEREDVPDDVLSDVNRHAPLKCSKCGTWFGVRITIHQESIIMSERTEPSDPQNFRPMMEAIRNILDHVLDSQTATSKISLMQLQEAAEVRGESGPLEQITKLS